MYRHVQNDAQTINCKPLLKHLFYYRTMHAQKKIQNIENSTTIERSLLHQNKNSSNNGRMVGMPILYPFGRFVSLLYGICVSAHCTMCCLESCHLVQFSCHVRAPIQRYETVRMTSYKQVEIRVGYLELRLCSDSPQHNKPKLYTLFTNRCYICYQIHTFHFRTAMCHHEN